MLFRSEDDVFFNLYGPKLDIKEIMKTLISPGLKIFNIHANFIACNTPSTRHYQAVRDNYFKSSHKESHLIHKGRGTYTVFKELLNLVEKNGFHFQCFQEFSDSLLENKRFIKLLQSIPRKDLKELENQVSFINEKTAGVFAFLKNLFTSLFTSHSISSPEPQKLNIAKEPKTTFTNTLEEKNP